MAGAIVKHRKHTHTHIHTHTHTHTGLTAAYGLGGTLHALQLLSGVYVGRKWGKPCHASTSLATAGRTAMSLPCTPWAAEACAAV